MALTVHRTTVIKYKLYSNSSSALAESATLCNRRSKPRGSLLLYSRSVCKRAQLITTFSTFSGLGCVSRRCSVVRFTTVSVIYCWSYSGLNTSSTGRIGYVTCLCFWCTRNPPSASYLRALQWATELTSLCASSMTSCRYYSSTALRRLRFYNVRMA